MAKAKGRRSANKKPDKPSQVVPDTGCVSSLEALAGWVGCDARTVKSWKSKHDNFPVEQNGTYRVRDVIEWRLNGFSSNKPETPEQKDDAEAKKQRFENAKLIETEANAIDKLIAARKNAEKMVSFEYAKQFNMDAFSMIRHLFEALPDEFAPEVPLKFSSDISKELRHNLTERLRNMIRLKLKRLSQFDITKMETD